LGFVPFICKSEDEAIEKSLNLDGKTYPVYFFESNTSGEKPYEEFYFFLCLFIVICRGNSNIFNLVFI
jgi:hypothetical protein